MVTHLYFNLFVSYIFHKCLPASSVLEQPEPFPKSRQFNVLIKVN